MTTTGDQTGNRRDVEERRVYPDSLRAELRREIVEAQRIGADFLKWKLIATATVASVAVGFWKADSPPAIDAKFLLCLIPLICAYVDMVSLDLAVRTMVIANFLRTRCHDAYEKHVHSLRDHSTNPFSAAPIAIHASSGIASALVAFTGLYGASNRNWDPVAVSAFQMFGILGIALAVLQAVIYNLRIRQLDDREPKRKTKVLRGEVQG